MIGWSYKYNYWVSFTRKYYLLENVMFYSMLHLLFLINVLFVNLLTAGFWL